MYNHYKYSLETSLGNITGKVSKALGKSLVSNFQNEGYAITVDEWVALAYLWRYHEQNQQQLVEAINRDKTAVTRLVDKMEKKDYVIRTSDFHDRRQNLIILTDKGRDMYEKLVKIVEKALHESCKDIDTRDIEICLSVLQKMSNNLS